VSHIFISSGKSQARALIRQAVEIIRQGGVIAYPTDSAMRWAASGGQDCLERIRGCAMDDKHNFTLVLRDLSELGCLRQGQQSTFRLLKGQTRGTYTFILHADHRRCGALAAPKSWRDHWACRIPQHPDHAGITRGVGRTLMSVTLIDALRDNCRLPIPR